MNWDQARGTWAQLRGKARRARGRATGDTLQQAEGSALELGGVIRRKMGDAQAATKSKRNTRGKIEESNMLWTIAIVLAVLWALGLVTSYTMGGFVHVLLVIALAVVLIRVIQGRRLV